MNCIKNKNCRLIRQFFWLHCRSYLQLLGFSLRLIQISINLYIYYQIISKKSSSFIFYFFFAIISYVCQCFIFPSPVLPSLSFSSKLIISNWLNKFKTSSFDKKTIFSFILTQESFNPKKFPTKYPFLLNTFNNSVPKFIKIVLTTKWNTKI